MPLFLKRERKRRERENNQSVCSLIKFNKHLSDLVHVTTKKKVLNLFAILVRRHITNPSAKPLKWNKTKPRGPCRSRYSPFSHFNLFSIFFSFFRSRDGPVPFVHSEKLFVRNCRVCFASSKQLKKFRERRKKEDFFHENIRLCLFHRRWIEARVRT